MVNSNYFIKFILQISLPLQKDQLSRSGKPKILKSYDGMLLKTMAEIRLPNTLLSDVKKEKNRGSK